jgi:hypothetical protein
VTAQFFVADRQFSTVHVGDPSSVVARSLILPALSALNGHGNLIVAVVAKTVMSAIAENLHRVHRFSVTDANIAARSKAKCFDEVR